jgi:leader peptidase (prepilin peptidase)/N-methyltransferase
MVATPEIGSPEMWVQYPHARREMMKELVFLAPAIGLAVGGAWVAQSLAGPWTPGPTPLSPGTFEHQVPLWLSALSGSLLGYLIGGGVVWGIRILGSLGFGKEAMGLGDVHLMAAVGACVGWIDATLAFFLSAFVALGFWVIRALVWRKGEAQMPYGPYLAIATLLVTVAKPLVEWGLNRIAPAWAPFNLP